MKNMSLIKSIILINVVALSSCGIQGHVQQTPGADLKNYKTFSWIPSSVDDQAAKSKTYKNFQESYLKASIAQELKNKGLTEVQDNADISVDYDVQVQRESRTTSEPVYSRPFIGYRYNRFTGRINQVYYPSRYLGSDYYQVPYRSGNITVNIVDNRTNEVAWQGWAETELDKKRLSSNEIDGIVKAIFKKYKN